MYTVNLQISLINTTSLDMLKYAHLFYVGKYIMRIGKKYLKMKFEFILLHN